MSNNDFGEWPYGRDGKQPDTGRAGNDGKSIGDGVNSEGASEQTTPPAVPEHRAPRLGDSGSTAAGQGETSALPRQDTAAYHSFNRYAPHPASGQQAPAPYTGAHAQHPAPSTPSGHIPPSGPPIAGQSAPGAASGPRFDGTAPFQPRPGAQGGPAAPYWHGQPPARRKSSLSATAAVALVAALLGGAGGAGIMYGLIEPTSNETATQQSTEVRTVSSDNGVNWAAISEQVQPSVVAIESSSESSASTGSGVIVDAEGHIVTNHHVIAGSRQIQVTLSDGTILSAQVVGSDASTDVAVLLLDEVPAGLTPATLGSSDNLVVGEPVVAIGNPLGLSSTVTTGIISALDRPVVTREDSASDAVVTNAIQIDAAINPGNSGGPLFNADGEVIGINSSIASLSSTDGGTSGSIGLGFAIPIDLVNRVVDDLLDDGTVDHAFIGVTTTSEVVTLDGTNQVAARVVEVSAGSPAEQYGLQGGDAILSINGHPLASNTALTGYVRQYAPGETVVLEVARDGSVTEIELVLGQRE